MDKRLLTVTTTLALFILFLSPPTTTADTADNVIVDIDNNPIVPGSYYYLLPSNNGGGLSTIPIGSPTCPTNFIVSQLSNRANLGIPVTFLPENKENNNDDKTIKLSSNIKIYNKYYETPSAFICPLVYSSFWALTGDAATGNIYVVLDGIAVKGSNRLTRPDPAWFQIEKVESSSSSKGYKIVFQPGVSVGNVVAGEVSVLESGNGQRLLTLDNKHSIVVQFVKA